MRADVVEIKPQPGPQTAFLSSSADLVIYGGAAGGGKSWALLAEPLRHVNKPDFGGVIFRRDRVQVTNEGGLWDEARSVYPLLNATPNNSDLFYTFPAGSSIGFAGLQQESDVLKWQGSQIAFLGFDELTHFTEYQFFYMFSRNRSKSAVRSYIRATTNPDADSWVAGFIEWWIDQKTGLPIKERAGVVRWLVRDGERNFWFDTQKQAADFAAERFAELMHQLEPEQFVKSVTFIPADVFDNPALLRNDPGYLANLLALPLVERERLLKGNWKVRATAGKVFNRDWFEIVDAMPQGGIDVRFFDLAATAPKLTTNAKKTDPDYTATVKMRVFLRPKEEPLWVVTDAFQVQAAPAQVERLVMQCAEVDRYEARVNGTRYVLRWEQEPGSASKRESYRWTAALRGYDAKGIVSRDDKVTRALALSAQAEQGRVKLLRGAWNGEFLTNLHGFPDLLHDDLVDAASGAFNASDTSGLVLTD